MPETSLSSNASARIYLEVNGQTVPLAACTLPDIDWATKEIPSGSTTPGGTTLIGEMHIGDLRIAFSPADLEQLPEWVDEIMRGKHDTQDLQLVRTNPLGKVLERIELAGCTLTELHFPECRANARNTYLVEAVIKPTTIKCGPADGQIAPAPGSKRTHWLVGNFALTVDELPTRLVSRVAGFSLKRQFSSKFVGEMRVPASYVGIGHCTPLSLSLTGPDYLAWRDFAFRLIQKGQDHNELSALLELRDNTLTHNLGAFHFRLAGLTGFHFDPPPAEGNGSSALAALASLAVSSLRLQTAP